LSQAPIKAIIKRTNQLPATPTKKTPTPNNPPQFFPNKNSPTLNKKLTFPRHTMNEKE
jgi:hypothetical protein